MEKIRSAICCLCTGQDLLLAVNGETGVLTSHLNSPGEPIVDISMLSIVETSMSYLIWTYCNPTNDAVKSANRIDSVEPLMDACPAHCAILFCV